MEVVVEQTPEVRMAFVLMVRPEGYCKVVIVSRRSAEVLDKGPPTCIDEPFPEYSTIGWYRGKRQR